MLRSNSELRPAPRFLGAFSGALSRAFVAVIFALTLPGLASATSTTIELTDPGGSGLGATLTIDDMLDPGNLSVTLALTSEAGATGDVRGFMQEFLNDGLFPDLGATGEDVYSTAFYPIDGGDKSGDDPCRCRLNVDLGDKGLLNPTGLQTTSFVISHPSIPLSLAGIEGETFYIAIGHDEISPILPLDGGKTNTPPSYIKLKGKIPVIPEPSTAVLMLLGLSGLSATSRRLASPRN